MSNTALKNTTTILLLVTTLLIVYANYYIFMVVPNEKVMGAVQRIFYFHVASAFATYLCAAGALYASISYLTSKTAKYDALNESAAELGLVFASILLATGMIWGKAAWNVWFRWEPRLVSSLLLWLIFLAMVLLRNFSSTRQVANQCAVLGIISAIMVPVVIYSVKLLPGIPQLHPQVVEKRGLKDIRFTYGMIISSFALLSLTVTLFLTRFRLALLRRN